MLNTTRGEHIKKSRVRCVSESINVINNKNKYVVVF